MYWVIKDQEGRLQEAVVLAAGPGFVRLIVRGGMDTIEYPLSMRDVEACFGEAGEAHVVSSCVERTRSVG